MKVSKLSGDRKNMHDADTNIYNLKHSATYDNFKDNKKILMNPFSKMIDITNKSLFSHRSSMHSGCETSNQIGQESHYITGMSSHQVTPNQASYVQQR